MTPRDRQTGRPTDTAIIGSNKLNLMHAMQPKNTQKQIAAYTKTHTGEYLIKAKRTFLNLKTHKTQ